jgi:PTS system mannose-specific IIA component
MPDNDPAQLVQAAHAQLDRLMEQNGVIVLSDVYGATPCNIAARLAARPEVRVLAGVNLPMLLRVVCYRTTPLDTLVDKALSGGAKGIQAVSQPSSAAGSLVSASPLTPCAAVAPAEPAKLSLEPVIADIADIAAGARRS